jgi:pimeloyl-ACP methyl ester carboxylesterase
VTAASTPAATARRTAWRFLRGALIVYAAWCLILYFLQSRMLFMPYAAGQGIDEEQIAAEPGLERMQVGHSDGIATEAWLVRSRIEPVRGLVCFLHGNAELIDYNLAEAREWNARGFDVLLPEYRGYGRSPGSPSQDAIVRDTLDAIGAVAGAGEYPSTILHGRSLGSGVAVQVALRLGDRCSAVIMDSPFRSVASFAWRYGVPPALVRNPFRSDEALPSLDCPILILHSPQDEIVPFSHGEALAALNPRATLVPLEGSHNSGLSMTRAYWSAIDALAAQLPGASQAADQRDGE